MGRIRKKLSTAAIGAVCLLVAACQTMPVSEVPADRQFDKVTGKLVMTAQDLAQTSDYEKAIEKLMEARAVPDLIPYEDSTISSMLGAYAYEVNDIPAAIQHFQNSISAGGLTDREVKSIQSNITQLRMNPNAIVNDIE